MINLTKQNIIAERKALVLKHLTGKTALQIAADTGLLKHDVLYMLHLMRDQGVKIKKLPCRPKSLKYTLDMPIDQAQYLIRDKKEDMAICSKCGQELKKNLMHIKNRQRTDVCIDCNKGFSKKQEKQKPKRDSDNLHVTPQWFIITSELQGFYKRIESTRIPKDLTS